MLYEWILSSLLDNGLILDIPTDTVNSDVPIGVWLYPSGCEIMTVGMFFDEMGLFHHYTGIKSCAHPYLKYWCKIIYAYLTYSHM